MYEIICAVFTAIQTARRSHDAQFFFLPLLSLSYLSFLRSGAQIQPLILITICCFPVLLWPDPIFPAEAGAAGGAGAGIATEDL